MTVLDNLLVGLHNRTRFLQLASLVVSPTVWIEERRLRRSALEMIDFMGLDKYQAMHAGALRSVSRSGWTWRGRSFPVPACPLDEPASGLSHEELRGLSDLIRKIRHDLKVTFSLWNTT
jgi:branched-chain amino acid transport system ATP-binding protein